jgi:hypothetical protein
MARLLVGLISCAMDVGLLAGFCCIASIVGLVINMIIPPMELEGVTAIIHMLNVPLRSIRLIRIPGRSMAVLLVSLMICAMDVELLISLISCVMVFGLLLGFCCITSMVRLVINVIIPPVELEGVLSAAIDTQIVRLCSRLVRIPSRSTTGLLIGLISCAMDIGLLVNLISCAMAGFLVGLISCAMIGLLVGLINCAMVDLLLGFYCITSMVRLVINAIIPSVELEGVTAVIHMLDVPLRSTRLIRIPSRSMTVLLVSLMICAMDVELLVGLVSCAMVGLLLGFYCIASMVGLVIAL